MTTDTSTTHIIFGVDEHIIEFKDNRVGSLVGERELVWEELRV